jgi:hypothetical protein
MEATMKLFSEGLRYPGAELTPPRMKRKAAIKVPPTINKGRRPMPSMKNHVKIIATKETTFWIILNRKDLSPKP